MRAKRSFVASFFLGACKLITTNFMTLHYLYDNIKISVLRSVQRLPFNLFTSFPLYSLPLFLLISFPILSSRNQSFADTSKMGLSLSLSIELNTAEDISKLLTPKRKTFTLSLSLSLPYILFLSLSPSITSYTIHYTYSLSKIRSSFQSMLVSLCVYVCLTMD